MNKVFLQIPVSLTTVTGIIILCNIRTLFRVALVCTIAEATADSPVLAKTTVYMLNSS